MMQKFASSRVVDVQAQAQARGWVCRYSELAPPKRRTTEPLQHRPCARGEHRSGASHDPVCDGDRTSTDGSQDTASIEEDNHER